VGISYSGSISPAYLSGVAFIVMLNLYPVVEGIDSIGIQNDFTDCTVI